MEMINRSAVIRRPKQPYLEWAKRDDEAGTASAVFESMHEEPSVFLLPEYEDDDTQRGLLREFWPVLFDEMLEGWLRDPDGWPKGRTLEMFLDWFEVQMMSVVKDSYLDEPLAYFE